MKTIKKNILFTFDYELFLGKRSGTADKCCIEPTNLLIDIFEEYSIKHAIFFVDTTYLLSIQRCNYPEAKEDLIKITKQLQDLILKGHYVFPHIHPHWLDASYIDSINQWDLSLISRYRFNSIDENERAQVFERSVKLLYEIIHPVCPSYKIDSYRAGGWCIQPFLNFGKEFDRHQIVNDFSVLRGMANNSEFQYFNFTNAPVKNSFLFENDPLVEVMNGRYREYVISVLEVPRINKYLNKILLKLLWRMNVRSLGDGIGASTSGGKGNTIENKEKEMVSLELLTSLRLPLYLDYIEENDYMQFISHPKMISAHNIKVFKKFLSKFTACYEYETDYKKMPLS